MKYLLVSNIAESKPKYFGKDDLSNFLDIAQNNTYAAFTNKPEEFEKLQELDTTFRKLITNISQQDDVVFGLFLIRCHSSFLNAIRTLLSGAVVETFILLRSVIESSLYSLHIDSNNDLWEVWINRHQSDQELKKCREEFSYRKIKATLVNKSPKLSKIIDSLYSTTIDFGAHPNERAITSNTKLVKSEKQISFSTNYLTGDSLSLTHAMKVTLQVGVGALSVFEKMRKERFRILGIDEVLIKIQVGL